ncbi:MAG: D-alanyl-D-alanine-adding enzyme [Candidatus Westeberhardia cardiocondylae]|nr:D-alanyl-D-alanine-adding enzyme [Candidatus Westeberhardia cardiocondylae]
MIPCNLHTISKIINAKLIGKNKKIFKISTDSRNIKNKKKCLFVALKGKKYDAHIFIKEAIILGAEAILVEKQQFFLHKTPQLIVSNTFNALIKIASWIRKQISIPIIGITGSSGKTTVKEMSTSILKQTGNVLSTKNNFNNNIGVILTLLRLNKKHNFAIIEIGANNFKEILWSTTKIYPKTVLINNIFISHLTGFKSLLGVAKAKSEIFSGLSKKGNVIINNDSNYLSLWKKKLKNKKIYKFSIKRKKNVNFFSKNIKYYSHGTSFTLYTPKGKCKIYIPLLGIHNVSNAIAAATLSISVNKNIKLSEIRSGLQKIKRIPGRLFPITLNKNNLLIDDSYNSNIGSTIEGIKILINMPNYRILIISDISELGKNKKQYHKILGKIINKTNINKTLSFGNISKHITKSIKKQKRKHFINKNLLILYLTKLLSKNTKTTTLIKGSRKFKMEEIVYFLKEKFNV